MRALPPACREDGLSQAAAGFSDLALALTLIFVSCNDWELVKRGLLSEYDI